MPTLKYYVEKGSPRLYSVHKPVTTVGKAQGNDVVIQGDEVLPNHLQIAFDGRDFIIEELERTGSLTINGKKKRRARLVHGDRVKIGSTIFKFLSGADVEAQYHEEHLDYYRSLSPGPAVEPAYMAALDALIAAE